MDNSTLCNLILAECQDSKKATANPELAGGLLDIIKGLSDKGMGVLELIEWGPKLISMFQQLAPHIKEVQARVQAIIEIVLNTFKPLPVVNPLG